MNLHRFSTGKTNQKMCSNITKPFTVFVEGNIGSGKTTFLEHFRQFEDITLLTEPVEEWRDLKGYNLLVRIYSLRVISLLSPFLS